MTTVSNPAQIWDAVSDCCKRKEIKTFETICICENNTNDFTHVSGYDSKFCMKCVNDPYRRFAMLQRSYDAFESWFVVCKFGADFPFRSSIEDCLDNLLAGKLPCGICCRFSVDLPKEMVGVPLDKLVIDYKDYSAVCGYCEASLQAITPKAAKRKQQQHQVTQQ
jgi:hypothetical protein